MATVTVTYSGTSAQPIYFGFLALGLLAGYFNITNYDTPSKLDLLTGCHRLNKYGICPSLELLFLYLY